MGQKIENGSVSFRLALRCPLGSINIVDAVAALTLMTSCRNLFETSRVDLTETSVRACLARASSTIEIALGSFEADRAMEIMKASVLFKNIIMLEYRNQDCER